MQFLDIWTLCVSQDRSGSNQPWSGHLYVLQKASPYHWVSVVKALYHASGWPEMLVSGYFPLFDKSDIIILLWTPDYTKSLKFVTKIHLNNLKWSKTPSIISVYLQIKRQTYKYTLPCNIPNIRLNYHDYGLTEDLMSDIPHWRICLFFTKYSTDFH